MNRLLLSALAAVLPGLAAFGANGFQKTPHGVRTEIDSVTVEVTFYSPSTVRVTKLPQSMASAGDSYYRQARRC